MAEGGKFADAQFSDPWYSFAHAMRDGTRQQSTADAQARYAQWIGYWGAQAHKRRSHRDLGIGLHAISDKYSPPHSGFQPYYGFGLGLAVHAGQELADALIALPRTELDAMISEMRDYYFQNMDPVEYLEATGYLYSHSLETGLVMAPTVGG